MNNRRCFDRVLVAVLLVAACLLAACGGSGGASGAGGGASGATAQPAAATGDPFDPPASVAMPEVNLPGGADDVIDVSHVNDGYVSVQATNAARLKFQVVNGEATYNYDLPNDGSATVYPMNMGDGAYRFRIMQNTSGSNYVELMSTSADVALSSEFAPFLVPNMFCDYTPQSSCVAKARELTASAANQGAAVELVCTYLVENISYDTGKARELSTTTGYVPDPDSTLATGGGICFDYASLAAAMLRSLGFPTKVITGYVGDGNSIYHAWIMVFADGTWKTGSFSVDPNTWSRVDVTFAAAGNSDFVGDGNSYTDRYVY